MEKINTLESTVDKSSQQRVTDNDLSSNFEHIDRNIDQISQSLEFSVNTNTLDTLTNLQKPSHFDYTQIEKMIKDHGCKAKIFNRNSIGGAGAQNPMDWSLSSMSFNNSAVNDTNIDNNRHDLYQLWHSFEVNTWTSFDDISKTLGKLCVALGVDRTDVDRTLGAAIRSQLVETINSDNDSPAMDSIKLDTLHSIQAIERNILSINEAITTISGNSTSMNKLEKDAITQIN